MVKINHPPVRVLHSIPGRLRLSLPTLTPGEAATLERQVAGTGGIVSVTANPVSKTALITSDPQAVTSAEVVRRVLLHLRPAHHCATQWMTEQEDLDKKQELKQFLLSGTLLAGALARRLLPRANASVSWIDYAAATATGYTVVLKAVQEMREEDGISLDTFSIIYLLLSAGTEKLLPATVVTWLANFSHIFFAHPHHRQKPPGFKEVLGAMEERREALEEPGGWASVAAAAAMFIAKGRQERPLDVFDHYREFNQRYQEFL
jgi:hypothetical protein